MIEYLFMAGGVLLLGSLARALRPARRVEYTSMSLEQAQAVCSPSRACTLTGAYGGSSYAEQRTNQRFSRTKRDEQQAGWRFGDAIPEGNRGHEGWWNNRAIQGEVLDARSPGQLSDGHRTEVINGSWSQARQLPEGSIAVDWSVRNRQEVRR